MIASFSGGKTSAYMTIKLKEKHPDLKVVFMNTGLEHEETLIFVDKVDKQYNLNIQWIEAVVNHGQKKSCTHKFVTFETATRGSQLFAEMIKKYGLMGPGFLHCTRELKQNPFKSWKRENAHKDEKTAIGIRADEMDRVDENYIKKRLTYPLLDWGIKKPDIIEFWKNQPFNLNIPEHHGNCLGCWKKSDRKLYTLAKENPAIFYELMKLEEMDTSRKMFRGRRTARDILRDAQTTDLDNFVDPNYTEGCKESCEVF